MTSRTLLQIGSVMVMVISAVVGATAFYFSQLWNLSFIKDIGIAFLVVSVLVLVSIALYIIVIRKGFKRFIYEE